MTVTPDVARFAAIEIAKHHKKTCPGEACTVSLYLLKVMAERCGAVFTSEDEVVFR